MTLGSPRNGCGCWSASRRWRSRTWCCSGGAAGTRCASPTCGCSTGSRPKRPAWRRHVPAGLFLAHARAARRRLRPADRRGAGARERATVMVAVDVSASMLATDVRPTGSPRRRTRPASSSADLPEQFNVGLVAFAGSASVCVPPGTDRARGRAPASTGSPRAHRPGRHGDRRGHRHLAGRDPHARRARPARSRRRPGWCCSPTAPTPPGGTRTRRRPRRPPAGVPVDTISFGTRPGHDRSGDRVSRCRSTARPCGRSPRRPAAATTRPAARDELRGGVRGHRQLGRLRHRAAGRLGPVHRHRPGAGAAGRGRPRCSGSPGCPEE